MRAIVVDDSAVQCRVMAALLRRDGWTVVEAPTARLAAQAYRGDQIDLVVNDLLLPGPQGTVLARWLRRQSGGRVPVVGVTAGVLPCPQAQARAGFVAVLAKPVRGPALRRVAQGRGTPAMAWAAAPLIDRARLDRLRADLGDGPVRLLVQRFLDEGRPLVASGLAADRHKLAGSAAVFGAVALALALQPAARIDGAGLQRLWNRVEQVYAGEVYVGGSLGRAKFRTG